MAKKNGQRDVEKDSGEGIALMAETLDVLKSFADGFVTTFKHLFRKPIPIL